MVNKTPIRIWLSVYIIDGVKGVLEAFIYSDAVGFGLGVVSSRDYCLV